MPDKRGDLPSPPQFKRQVFKSAQLSTLKFVSDILLRLISTVVLTRLLAPEIYGVFAVVLLYMYLLEMFSDLGLRSLVLTKEEPIEDSFLSTCWVVSILRGFAIFLFSGGVGLIILTLQLKGVFAADNAYAAAELPLAVLGLGAAAFLKSAQSPMLFMAERSMKFERVILTQISANIISLIVTVALAFYLRSIWALVLGVFARSAFEVGASFTLFSNPRLSLSLNRKDLMLVYNRGKWIVGHSILTAMSLSADRLCLGFLMTSSSFGYYTIARQILEVFERLLNSLHAQMGLQVFRHILEQDSQQFRDNYYKYRLIFDAAAGICFGGLVVTAPLLIDIIFDDRYRDVAGILQILCATLLLFGPVILREAFSASRQFKEMTLLSIVSACSIWISMGISIFVFDSITVALFCIALYRLPEAVILFIKGRKRGWVQAHREMTFIPFVALGATIGTAVLFLGQRFL